MSEIKVIIEERGRKEREKREIKREETEAFHTEREERRRIKGKKKLITFKVPDDQLREVAEMAKEIGTTITEVIIMAIKEFVENEIAYERYKRTGVKWKIRFVEEEEDE